MHRTILIAALVLGTATTGAIAQEDDPGGTLNPQDTGFGRIMRNVDEGALDMTTCATGYYITKSGRHELARKLFLACAEAGYTGAMTWMSQLDNNGLGADYNPDEAANWDKKAADAGDPVGKFNYGLDLLRGHGVTKNETLGRQYVDQAASEGLQIARRLQGAAYDLDEVTPDADNWKYAPLF